MPEFEHVERSRFLVGEAGSDTHLPHQRAVGGLQEDLFDTVGLRLHRVNDAEVALAAERTDAVGGAVIAAKIGRRKDWRTLAFDRTQLLAGDERDGMRIVQQVVQRIVYTIRRLAGHVGFLSLKRGWEVNTSFILPLASITGRNP